MEEENEGIEFCPCCEQWVDELLPCPTDDFTRVCFACLESMEEDE
jgi:hypothetical protein